MEAASSARAVISDHTLQDYHMSCQVEDRIYQSMWLNIHLIVGSISNTAVNDGKLTIL